MAKRPYTQRKRAEKAERTRERIVEATMELHERLGAARTTISAVAREAGVQRLTVYRHFPDDAALLQACTSTWLDRNPLPAADSWQGAADPVLTAFAVFFDYYRRTERMWVSSYRDVDVVDALREPMRQVERYLDGIADELAGMLDRKADDRRTAYVTVRHGLRFSSWQSLVEAGMGDREAAQLVRHWVDCA